MIQIYKWIWIVLMVVALCSCRREDGYGEIPDEVVPYENAGQVVAAVDSLYHHGAPAFYGERFQSDIPAAAVGGYLTGFFENHSTRSSALYDHCNQLTFNAGNIGHYLTYLWEQAYTAIRISGELIDRTAGTPGLTPDQQSHIIAEARFFRAYNYFYLAKAFGEIPVVNDYRYSPEASVNSSLTAVYSLIVSDLRLAVSYLMENTANDHTRIGRTAAQTLLADVYLTMSGYPLRQDQYQQAADMARSVIRNGSHSLLENGSSAQSSAYNVLMDNADNPECIYRYVPLSGTPLAVLCLPDESSDWGVAKRTARNLYQPSEAFLGLYDPALDLRIREKQFFHSFLKYERNGRTVIQTYAPLSYMWFDENALLGTGTSRKGTILYRYAEVLLIAAESIAHTEGVTQEAVDYLSQVRMRAYPETDALEITAMLSLLSPEQFIEEIWTERLREFALEMKAWSDIQRTRKYPEPLFENDGMSVRYNDVVGSTSHSGHVFKADHLLFPLPEK